TGMASGHPVGARCLGAAPPPVNPKPTTSQSPDFADQKAPVRGHAGLLNCLPRTPRPARPRAGASQGSDDMNTNLVTVFGGSGFVGRHTVRALARAGWRIRVAVRHPNRAFFLRPLGSVGQIDIVKCDITDPDQVARAIQGADAVVNLCGILFQGAQTFEEVQADGAANIAQAAAAAGVGALVHVSALGADTESDSEYAVTKAEGEEAVREVFPKAVILRPSIVFGPEDSFFNKFAALARFTPALPLIGGGRTRFQP